MELVPERLIELDSQLIIAYMKRAWIAMLEGENGVMNESITSALENAGELVRAEIAIEKAKEKEE